MNHTWKLKFISNLAVRGDEKEHLKMGTGMGGWFCFFFNGGKVHIKFTPFFLNRFLLAVLDFLRSSDSLVAA